MSYKLAIFDLDGTILNTLDDLADSTNYALEKNNFPTRTIEEVKKFVGNGIGKLIERAVPEDTDETKREKTLKDFTTYYGVHCKDKTSPYDGIMDMLKELRKNGILLAVVSNKVDFAVQELCEQYFPGVFDFVVGERKNIRRKPAPDTVLEVLKTLKIRKEDAVYIGDSDVDIQTANNAKMDVISVSWGFREREFLIENGATTVIDSPKQISEIVCKN